MPLFWGGANILIAGDIGLGVARSPLPICRTSFCMQKVVGSQGIEWNVFLRFFSGREIIQRGR